MYEAFYKLQGKPFRLTPDPAMLFPSKGHQRAMSYLLYGLDQGEGFVMVTGPVGAGKTLLIQKLLENLAQRNIAVASIASANLDSGDILPALAAEFELAYENRSKEALLQDLKQHLIALGTRHAHALLVVDEAQTLTPAALEMLRILSNMQVNGRALLQIFLVGQGELRRVMVDNHMEQLRQRIITSFKLEPMDAEETRAYILHRLHAVGWKNDPEIAPGVFAGVHKASRGIPRKINLTMDRLLLYGYLEERHAIDVAALNTVLAEMRDEMPEAPQSLEPPPVSRRPESRRNSVLTDQESEMAALELKRSQILLDLMKEELRLKQMLANAGAPLATHPADHEAAYAEAEELRRANEQAIDDARRLREAKSHK